MNDFILSLMLMGALSTGESLPFWMTSNQYGLMPEHNGALALVQAQLTMSRTVYNFMVTKASIEELMGNEF